MRRKDWVETDGTIATVEEHQGRNSKSYTVVFTYKVDGHFYGGTYTTWTDEPIVGDPIAVKYDPDDPERNDLVLKETIMHWVIGGVIVLVAIVIIVAQFM
jgi:hypothetical protein